MSDNQKQDNQKKESPSVLILTEEEVAKRVTQAVNHARNDLFHYDLALSDASSIPAGSGYAAPQFSLKVLKYINC